MNELALFAGAGGGILGGSILGWNTVCAVEIDPYCRRVLLARQRDGALPRFPIWDDVRTFDGLPWRGKVDVVSGGAPCQDISAAGRGAGITGARSGLWKEFARIIGEVRPRSAFIENSPNLRTRGLVVVLQDLAELGYDAEWCVLGASDVGAPHRRKRMWIRAHTNGMPVREQSRWGGGEGGGAETELIRSQWWSAEPSVGRVAHGIPHRVDRLRAIGNAQVPTVAARAWDILSARGR